MRVYVNLGLIFGLNGSKMVQKCLSVRKSVTVQQMKCLDVNKPYVILDEISINQPKIYQKIVCMRDSNIFQNTLSKTYKSAHESYRYVNLDLSFGLKCSIMVQMYSTAQKVRPSNELSFCVFLSAHRKKTKWNYLSSH